MKLIFAIILSLRCINSLGQQENISVLKMESRVIDLANLLSADQKKSIFLLMEQLENKVGSQIAIITVETLYGHSINEYTRNQANQMGLGRKKFKDGILIVFAFNEGLLRTEVGKGLSKIITGEVADRVNQNIIAPLFRARNYSQGIYNGIKALSERIEANQNLIGKY